MLIRTMKAIVEIKKDNYQLIAKAINGGNFADANEFLNYLIELYDKDSNSFSDQNDIPGINDLISKHNNNKEIDYRGHFTKSAINKSNLEKIIPKIPNNYNLQKIWDSQSILSGQVNRYFAIKSALSIAARSIITNGSDGFIQHDNYLNIAKPLILDLISEIQDIDLVEKTKYSIGFPRINRSYLGYKTQIDPIQLFINKYFWTIRRVDKQVGGSLAKLNFINVYKDQDQYKICLTKEGLDFLKISNPIHQYIDLKKDYPHTFMDHGSISGLEVKFLIKHIKKILPNEYKAMTHILKSINDGNNNPEKLSKSLMDNSLFGSKKKIIELNRNGLLARLVEIRLVEKEKINKTKVKYLLTDSGVKLL